MGYCESFDVVSRGGDGVEFGFDSLCWTEKPQRHRRRGGQCRNTLLLRFEEWLSIY